jgi:cytoskeletal protein CcmA (bactofilin family)
VAEGAVKVTGEVDVGTGTILGALSVGGSLRADSFECRGPLDVEGTVTVTGPFSLEGPTHLVGAVHAGQATFSGTTRSARDISVDGILTVHGHFAAPSLHVGELRVDGALDIPGEIEAVNVDVRIRKPSRLGTIRARSVRLVRQGPNPVERVLGRAPPPAVVRIEAGRVELEGVEVAFVRSPEIVLGRDAQVTEFEGTITRRHPTARVGPESRSAPPHGLSR